MKRWQGISIILIIMVLLVYLFWSMDWIKPKFAGQKCNQVTIDVVDDHMNHFVSKSLVGNILKQNKIRLVGQSLSRIQLKKIEDIIERNAMVSKVVCYRTPDGDLKIKIWQRVPEFRIINNSGESYYVDKNQQIMPVSLSSTAYVPVVTGFVSKDFAKNKLFSFVEYIKNDKFLDAQIEQIYVHSDSTIDLIPRVGSQVICLGGLARYESKLDKLKTFYKKVMPKVGWNHYSRINLEYKDQVVCTK